MKAYITCLIVGISFLSCDSDESSLDQSIALIDSTGILADISAADKYFIPRHKITFRVIPAYMSDSSDVYIYGNNSFLRGFPKTPLEKQADGAWSKTFLMPEKLKVEFKISRGTLAKEAVDANGDPLGNFFFIVSSDTNITINVANWKDAIANLDEGLSDKTLGDIYFDKLRFITRSSEYDTALVYLRKASELYRKGSRWRKLAESYRRTGVIWGIRGHHEKTIEFCNKALQIALTRLPEGDPYVATIHDYLAHHYIDQHDFDLALEHINKTIDIWTRAYGEDYHRMNGCYSMIANIYGQRLEPDYHKALVYYNKSLLNLINSGGETHQDVGECYKDIAITYAQIGDYDRAIEYYKKALAIKFIYYDESHNVIAIAYQDLAMIYLEKGEFTRAERYLKKALATRLRIYGDNGPHVAHNYLRFAKLYFKQNSLEKAIRYAQKTIDSFLAEGYISQNDQLLAAYALKANTHFEQYSQHATNEQTHLTSDLELAMMTHEEAFKMITKRRNTRITEKSNLYLAGLTRELYGHAIQTALKLNELTKENSFLDKAFLFVERSKSSVLKQAMQKARARKFTGIPDEVLKREKSLRIELTLYETRLLKDKRNNTPARAQEIKEYERKYSLLKSKYEALIADFESRYPAYHELKYQTKMPSVSELQNTLDDQTAIVEYFVDDKAVYIVTITEDDFDVISVPKDNSFTTLVNTYFTSIKRVLDKTEYVESSTKLYETLITPIARTIASKNKLIIIPDEILFYVPFEALLTTETAYHPNLDFTKLDYFIRQYEIAYQHSAGLYLNSLEEKPIRYVSNFVGFAPVFSERKKNGYILDSNRPTLESYALAENVPMVTRDGKRLVELKYSEIEVQEITKMFDRRMKGSIGFFHNQASEENFKADVWKYKFVHVSSHGFMNEDNPRLSGIAFSQPQGAVKAEDGIFYSAEAYNLDLNADLVVLSSCESGVGKLVKGERLMALTRGFLYSGASNVIVSLWKVFDEQTSQLMIELYKQILTGNSYSKALQQAKLKMIDNKETAYPSDWSSFVMIGPIVPDKTLAGK